MRDEDRESGLGLRERNKQEKLMRIQKAAWALFREKGYELTTTREVAERAQVGIGTLFLYAKDKQELIQLAYHDAIEEVIDQAFSSLPEDVSWLDALLHIFKRFFELYQSQLENARAYIKATVFMGDTQKYGQQAMQQIARFNQRLAHLLVQYQKQGVIKEDIDLNQASSNLFALYFSTLGLWLSGFLSYGDELESYLRQAFELQMYGLATSKEKGIENDRKDF